MAVLVTQCKPVLPPVHKNAVFILRSSQLAVNVTALHMSAISDVYLVAAVQLASD